MCNACGFLCCGYDGFSRCGCDHCLEPACWDEEEFDEDEDGMEFSPAIARPSLRCIALPDPCPERSGRTIRLSEEAMGPRA